MADGVGQGVSGVVWAGVTARCAEEIGRRRLDGDGIDGELKWAALSGEKNRERMTMVLRYIYIYMKLRLYPSRLLCLLVALASPLHGAWRLAENYRGGPAASSGAAVVLLLYVLASVHRNIPSFLSKICPNQTQSLQAPINKSVDVT